MEQSQAARATSRRVRGLDLPKPLLQRLTQTACPSGGILHEQLIQFLHQLQVPLGPFHGTIVETPSRKGSQITLLRDRENDIRFYHGLS